MSGVFSKFPRGPSKRGSSLLMGTPSGHVQILVSRQRLYEGALTVLLGDADQIAWIESIY